MCRVPGQILIFKLKINHMRISIIVFALAAGYLNPDQGVTDIKAALDGGPLHVFGDGRQTRSFCYVQDLVEGLFRLLQSELSEPVNLGPNINTPGGREYTPYVSPDGRYFFFMSTRAAAEALAESAALSPSRSARGDSQSIPWPRRLSGARRTGRG